MATLIVKTQGGPPQVIQLKLGLNKLGRSSANDFQIEHATVSATHCEVMLRDDGVSVIDCDSTNGTFINGEPITEGKLEVGQILQLGDVELVVESTEVKIEIPKYEEAHPAPPPVVLTDGSLLCPRHAKAQVTHQCTHCQEVMCSACVRRMRRRGGKVFQFCPLCSHPVEAIGASKKRKSGLLEMLARTIKLPRLRERRKP